MPARWGCCQLRPRATGTTPGNLQPSLLRERSLQSSLPGAPGGTGVLSAREGSGDGEGTSVAVGRVINRFFFYILLCEGVFMQYIAVSLVLCVCHKEIFSWGEKKCSKYYFLCVKKQV